MAKWKIKKNRWFNTWVAIHPNGAVWHYGPSWHDARDFVDDYLQANACPEPTD